MILLLAPSIVGVVLKFVGVFWGFIFALIGVSMFLG